MLIITKKMLTFRESKLYIEYLRVLNTVFEHFHKPANCIKMQSSFALKIKNDFTLGLPMY